MKEGWKYVKLGEVCDKYNGLWKGKKPPFVQVGVIRNANFTKEFTLDFSKVEYLDVEQKQYQNRKLEQGDLIVEKSGGSDTQPVGRTILFDKKDGEFSFSNFTSVLRIKDRNLYSPKFLFLYLLHVYKSGATLKMQSATTGIHNLDFEKFLSIPIPVLSLAEQEEIVGYLDKEFALVDALREKAGAQLQAAKDLFQAALKQLLTPKDGWEEKKLGEVVHYHKENGFHKNLPYIGLEHIESGTGKLLGTITSNGVLSTSYKFSKGELLYGRLRPYLKKCLIADFDGCCSTEIFPILSNGINLQFLKYWFLSDEITEKINATSAGCRMPRGNMNQVLTFPIYLSPLPEQESIVARLDSLSEKCRKLEDNYRQTLSLCNDLKQALLKQVFE